MPNLLHPNKLVVRQEMQKLNSIWHPDDSKEKWLENKERLPDRYQNKEAVKYIYNCSGYRGEKEIRDYKGEYLVSFGCSNTEGLGINYEETYSYLLAEKLGVDVMNLGIAGSSIDLVATNITQLVKLICARKLKAPKYVIVQWPGCYRKTFTEMLLHGDHYTLNNLNLSNDINDTTLADTYDREWVTNRYAIYTEHLNYEVYKNITSSNLMLQLMGTNVINFELSADACREDNYLLRDFNMHDMPFMEDAETYARDMIHAGVESNARWALTLHDAMT